MIKRAAVFCPNPGVDRIYRLTEPLFAGGLFRAAQVETAPGSKGANAALALLDEGVPVTVMTFSGGAGGKAVEEVLSDRGAAIVRVQTGAGVRQNIKLVEPDGKSTEINEKGGPVSEKEAAELLQLAGNGGYDALLLCGSLPQGVRGDYYAKAIAAAKKCGAVTFLDTSGAALLAGVGAAPDYIKPNSEELAALTGEKEPQTAEEAVALAKKWHEEHPETAVICTLGKAGAVLVCKEGVFRQEAKPVAVNSTVGAGDAFLAGFAAAILKGETARAALAAGTECAAAHISHPLRLRRPCGQQ